MKKKIEYILEGREKHITKEDVVLQPLSHKDFRFANPFIVLHHQRPQMVVPGSESRLHPHPHRGFAPVTFMLQGESYHKDSAGDYQIIGAGDAQWMFAGKGILHSEGPSKQLLENGGVYELIQLWVNVPKSHKWDEPFYRSATKVQQPKVLEQEGVELRLVSGSFDNKTGPLVSITPVISIIGSIEKGRQVQFTAHAGYWTLIYLSKGSITVNQETINQYNLIVFEKENEEIILTATEDAQILFLSAQPINEPVAAKDNFVMNTPEEIELAIADFNKGVFGTLDS